MPRFPAGPRGLPVIGNTLSFARQPHIFMLETARQYGDIAHMRLLGQDAYVLSNPDFVQDVLIRRKDFFTKSERSRVVLRRFLGEGLLVSVDEYHSRQRRMVQPAFHATRIHAYADAMVAIAMHTATQWEQGATRNIHHDMMVLTMEVVSQTLFGGDVMEDAMAVGNAMAFLQEVANKRFTNPLMPPPWIKTPTQRKAIAAGETIDTVVMRFIRERRAAATPDQGDLLSMLLLSTDENGQRMNDEEVRAEALTLFSAGHETTSNLLTWTWHLLAENPDVEARLHAELDRVLGNRLPVLSDLRQLPYTHMVLKETLRLYPPAWTLMAREIVRDATLGEYQLPAGGIVFVAPYVLHRHPDLWVDPQRFIPERFAPEQESKHHKYQYIPFGGGEHVCIGNSYAMLEAALVLATLAQRFYLRKPDQHIVRERALVTLMPDEGLPMIVHQRQAVPV